MNFLGILLLAGIWGTNFLFVEEALEGLNPAQIVMVRIALGTAALLLLAWVRRVGLPSGRAAWWRLAVMGLLGQAIPWLLFAWGQEEVPSALAGVYNGMTPLLTIPIAWLLLRSRPSPAELTATGIGFVGIAIVLKPWSAAGGAASIAGQVLCLAGAACYAFAYTYAARLMRELPNDKLALAAAQALATSALMLPTGTGWYLEPIRLSWTIVASLAMLGAGTAVAFLVNYWLIARIGPVRSSLAFYLIPVVAVAAGFVVRGERLEFHQFFGSVLVFAALLVIYVWQRFGERRATPDAVPARS
ncbi:hypothetical protein Acsp04_63080 [Actinomadura sp. NBRC 104425]|uniref:DMT family transporter n=1 Tax=Actinomadura sp. NBRC 104425 TaxID=3032204 RepID=UPI0024A176D8|nr:DMT family transporter [Actinomadura sp. NBRC 104425]GLZ16073.1 hypothetical protein Acsp04_63080 [Actinomadura sp. NBRC 104425]